MQKARCGRDDFLVCLVGFDFEHSLAFLDLGSGSFGQATSLPSAVYIPKLGIVMRWAMVRWRNAGVTEKRLAPIAPDS